MPSAAPKTIVVTHRFWDRENDWLFAGVGAGRGLDYASTLNMRRRGIDEIFLTNSIVDNHPLFGGNRSGGHGGFHRRLVRVPSHRASST